MMRSEDTKIPDNQEDIQRKERERLVTNNAYAYKYKINNAEATIFHEEKIYIWGI